MLVLVLNSPERGEPRLVELLTDCTRLQYYPPAPAAIVPNYSWARPQAEDAIEYHARMSVFVRGREVHVFTDLGAVINSEILVPALEYAAKEIDKMDPL